MWGTTNMGTYMQAAHVSTSACGIYIIRTCRCTCVLSMSIANVVCFEMSLLSSCVDNLDTLHPWRERVHFWTCGQSGERRWFSWLSWRQPLDQPSGLYWAVWRRRMMLHILMASVYSIIIAHSRSIPLLQVIHTYIHTCTYNNCKLHYVCTEWE